jgi:hypothetical protein
MSNSPKGGKWRRIHITRCGEHDEARAPTSFPRRPPYRQMKAERVAKDMEVATIRSELSFWPEAS